jgi:hypothetical protein
MCPKVFDNIVCRHQGKTGWPQSPVQAVNQRVKSAIGTSKKIDTNSRPIEGEKELRPSGRPLGRIALHPLFATKVPEGGWGARKVY